MASWRIMRQSGGVDTTTENFIWASMFWGAIGAGYLVYGWRQKAGIPFAGGAALTAASFFLPALWMTVAAVLIMFAVWWLLKQGY